MRIIRLSSLLGAVTAGALPAQHYRAEITSQQAINMASLGMPDRTIKTGSTASFTVTMSDTVGGQLAHIVVDSATFDDGDLGAMLDPSVLGEAVGAVFHLYIVKGRIQGTPLPQHSGLRAMTLVPAVAMLFPGVPAGASPGTTWTDTVRSDSSMATGHVASTTITVWSVTGSTGETLVLEGNATGTTSAELGAMGQMNGTTIETRHVTTTPNGPAVSADRQTSVEMLLVMDAGQGAQPAGIKGTSTVKVWRR